MDFENQMPEWKNTGAEPSDELKTNGFQAGYKPPANIFNYFFSLLPKAIKELQTKLSGHDTADNPHGITAEKIGLDKVNNTPDSEKSVKFASEAGVGRKTKYALSVRFKGGSTEGTDLFTFDGSTSKSVNITPVKIGAAESDHIHTLEEIPETEQLKVSRIVTANSTDGITYTADVDGVTELYNGLEITIIPVINNSTTAPTLNINGLGAVRMHRPLSFSTFTATAPEANFIRANTPCRIMYHENYASGGIWLLAEKQKTSAQDLYGRVPIESGGTGATTAEDAREKLGAAYTFATKVEVPNTAWVLENEMYKQTVACSGLLATDTPIVDVFTNNYLPDDELFIEAWGHIKTVIANDDELVLYTDGELPTVSFSMNVKVVR